MYIFVISKNKCNIFENNILCKNIYKYIIEFYYGIKLLYLEYE